MTTTRDRLRAELQLVLDSPGPVDDDLVERLVEGADGILQAALAEVTVDRQAAVERAAAVGMINGSVPPAEYLQQLSAVLQRNLTIREQTDLARTVRAEGDRLAGIATNLVALYPELRVVDEVAARVGDTRPQLLVPGGRTPSV